MPDEWYLVADIGGTNTRFAAFHGGRLVSSVTHETAQSDDILASMRAFSETLPHKPGIIVVAAAGPVEGNAVTLTNSKHALCGDKLSAATGAKQAYVINDFAAAAWATVDVAPSDLQVIAGAPALAPGARVVIGPGTGLGVGALAFDGTRYQSVTGEGGHIGIGPRSRDEVPVFEALRTLWPDVFFGEALIMEAEGILGGVGLPTLFRAVQLVEGVAQEFQTPAEIFEQARAGNNPAACKTISIYKAHLAKLAGDFGLAFGARSGVIFVGGMATKNPWLFDAEFAAQVSEGGRFSQARQCLNLYLLRQEDFGLRGAHRFAMMCAKK